MRADLIGRIANTRLSSQQALLPVFEAVVNAILSCTDLDSESPEITIKLLRGVSQSVVPGTGILNPIDSFEISDTGVGFDEHNYESFQTADSRYRAKMGGKGIGRFLWLVAFDRAEIESTFQDKNGEWMHRSFKFGLTPEGIEDHQLAPAAVPKRLTTVRLVGVKEKYWKSLPKSALVIANRIVEHCLQYFLLGLKSSMCVVDDHDPERIMLIDLFNAQIETHGASVPIDVAGHNFQIRHLRVRPTYGDGHRLYFCADKRLVTSEKLEGKLPNLESSIRDENDKPFVYSGYVSGAFLDETVNSERTEFVMPDENSAFGDPTWNTLLSRVSQEAKTYLEPFTATVKKEKEERIKEYVRSKAPTFRPLVKHRPDILDAIPYNLTDDKLDVELYRHNQEYERDLREEGEKLVASIQDSDTIAIRATYNRFLEEWNESGIAKLANHVAYRKATLKILRGSLSLKKDAKYSLEEAVHQIICPLRKTSDDIPADQMNLWIIDERLAYHFYLASDVPFSSIKQDVVKVDSLDRVDLLIFDSATAFVDEEAPFSSVVIVEFKRPARNDYTDEENPINQVYRYVKLIREGKAFDRRGRPISVPDHIPFYAYIVADLTTKLRDQASFSGFHPNHDSTGYFTFNPQLRTYVEMMSFDHLILNAERRNKYFFDQLNLPS
jgi:hypothetical protein